MSIRPGPDPGLFLPVMQLDLSMAESRYLSEPVDAETPEVIFEKRWAQAVLDRTVARLRAELSEGAVKVA